MWICDHIEEFMKELEHACMWFIIINEIRWDLTIFFTRQLMLVIQIHDRNKHIYSKIWENKQRWSNEGEVHTEEVTQGEILERSPALIINFSIFKLVEPTRVVTDSVILVTQSTFQLAAKEQAQRSQAEEEGVVIDMHSPSFHS